MLAVESENCSETCKPFSEKELKVMSLATLGLSHNTIAREAKISPSTLKSQFTRIRERFEVDNTDQAIVMGIQDGSLHLDEAVVAKWNIDGISDLTPKALDIFPLLQYGLGNREIAELRNLQHQDVKNCVMGMKDILGFESRTEAILMSVLLYNPESIYQDEGR